VSCKVLRAAPSFGPHVQPGKQALERAHRGRVDLRAPECSVYLDEHGPKKSGKRWDYILVSGDGRAHGVEVHPAKTDQGG
jgi:hypothetical protein